MSTRSFPALLLALSGSLNLHAATAPVAPPPTDFRVVSAFPKYVTADIEFRDVTGVKWPNFFYGKPATDAGYIRLDPVKPAAAFALLCDKMAQPNGDQSRKVLGELCPPGQAPAVTLTVTAMGALQAAVGAKDKAALASELTGLIEVAGRKLPVKIPVTLRHHSGKGDEKNPALMLEGKFAVKALAVGLKALAPDAMIEVRVALTAYPSQAAAVRK